MVLDQRSLGYNRRPIADNDASACVSACDAAGCAAELELPVGYERKSADADLRRDDYDMTSARGASPVSSGILPLHCDTACEAPRG